MHPWWMRAYNESFSQFVFYGKRLNAAHNRHLIGLFIHLRKVLKNPYFNQWLDGVRAAACRRRFLHHHCISCGYLEQLHCDHALVSISSSVWTTFNLSIQFCKCTNGCCTYDKRFSIRIESRDCLASSLSVYLLTKLIFHAFSLHEFRVDSPQSEMGKSTCHMICNKIMWITGFSITEW